MAELVEQPSRRREAAPPARRPRALPAAARAGWLESSTARRATSTSACSRAPRRTPAPTTRFRSSRRRRSLDGALFFAPLPPRARARSGRLRPDAVVAEDPRDGGARARRRRARRARRAARDLEVHGDWRAATRLYGSPPAGACCAARRRARRLAFATRTRSARSRRTRPARRATSGRPPDAVFPPTSTLGSSSARRAAAGAADCALRRRARALQERGRARGGVAARGGARSPEARAPRRRAGPRRAVVDALVAELPGRRARPSLPPRRRPRARRARVLVLPSRSEGLGRVVIEAFCRGRGVVGSRAGGSPISSRTASTACSSTRSDADGLADALLPVLSDRALAERLAAAARAERRAGTRRPRSSRGGCGSSWSRALN